MPVDPKSYELAKHFLSDYVGNAASMEELCDQLANVIQERVEDWLSDEGLTD
jgi:hypothetical protein